MARTSNESGLKNQETDHNHPLTFQAGHDGPIELPSSDFIADAKMTRDGDDLILQAPHGEVAVIEGYFSADPAPLLRSPDGATLTPQLVHSFAHSPLEFAANNTATDESPIGKIDEVKGHVTVTHADGTVETATRGTVIYENDQIQTDAQGAANIIFMDESTMAVSENARLSIDQYVFDPSTENGTTNFSMLRGLFVYVSGLIGRDDPDHVKIDTPVGSIGIRGTVIAGEIHPGGQSNISVLEGAIVVKNGAMETTLSKQFETVRLSGLNDKMESLGVVPANDIAEKFHNIGSVAPSLFSTINDAVKEQSGSDPSHNQSPQSNDAHPDTSTKPNGPDDHSHETLGPSSSLSIFSNLGNDLASLNVNAAGLPSLRAVLGLAENHIESAGALATIIAAVNAVTAATPGSELAATKINALNDIIKEALASSTPSQIALSESTVPPFLIGTKTEIPDPVFRTVISGEDSNKFGFSIAATGDFNKDGYDDFLVSNGNGGTIYLFAGNGTTEPTQINLGSFLLGSQTLVTSIGDFNGDGKNDYAVGQSTAFVNGVSSGNIAIISGDSNDHLTFTSGLSLNIQLGSAISGIGDYNNDGYADVIASAPQDAGAVYYIAGRASFSGNLNGLNPILGAATGDKLGTSAIGIGDVNGDGYSDFAVGSPGANTNSGSVQIYVGSNGVTPSLSTTITGNTGEQLGTKLSYLGDINGDGKSDFFIGGKEADNVGYISFGGSAPGKDIHFDLPSTSYKLGDVSGAGDFNGDGYDDFVVRIGNVDTNDSSIFVVFGKEGYTGTLDYTYLQDSSNAREFTLDNIAPNVKLNLSALGDVNGDGYDDFAISNPNAEHVDIIYGRDTSRGGALVQFVATGNNQSLVGTTGDDTFNDMGQSKIAFHGGAGNDLFKITSTDFVKIDGGSGNADTIQLAGPAPLDFSAINYEKISGIETLKFGGLGQTMTLTAENLFNLLKTSDTGELRIIGSSAGTTSTLNLVDTHTGDDYTTGAKTDQVAAFLRDNSGNTAPSHTSVTEGSTTYDSFKIGGYTLLIDQNVTVDAQ